VIYSGSTPVGNATLVVANVLTCNKHSPIYKLSYTNSRSLCGSVTSTAAVACCLRVVQMCSVAHTLGYWQDL
jgi:hypothetical protein